MSFSFFSICFKPSSPVQGCLFSKLASDAFDGDFVNGTIQDCFFSEINGDGVDFSGSNAEVSACKFSNIEDKAISVGEGSHVKVSRCKIENVSFGVVSKDLSTTEVYDKSEITNASSAAFAAFQKKSSFGPATIDIKNSRISESNKISLIQEGSSGFLDSKRISTKSFSISDLYKSESE